MNFEETPLVFAHYDTRNSVEQMLTDFLKYKIHSNNSIVSLKLFYHGTPVKDVSQQIATLTKNNERISPFRIIYENHGTIEEYREKI